MTYINKVAKLLLQLGYWVRFGAVCDRSITETCASSDGKCGHAGKTAAFAHCGTTLRYKGTACGRGAWTSVQSAATAQGQCSTTRGTLTAKTVPRPTRDRTVTGWSSISAMRRTIDSPNPNPRPLSRWSVPQR